MNFTNAEMAAKVNKTFEEEFHAEASDLIQVKEIEAFSYCGHNLALMYDMKVSVC